MQLRKQNKQKKFAALLNCVFFFFPPTTETNTTVRKSMHQTRPAKQGPGPEKTY